MKLKNNEVKTSGSYKTHEARTKHEVNKSWSWKIMKLKKHEVKTWWSQNILKLTNHEVKKIHEVKQSWS